MARAHCRAASRPQSSRWPRQSPIAITSMPRPSAHAGRSSRTSQQRRKHPPRCCRWGAVWHSVPKRWGKPASSWSVSSSSIPGARWYHKRARSWIDCWAGSRDPERHWAVGSGQWAMGSRIIAGQLERNVMRKIVFALMVCSLAATDASAQFLLVPMDAQQKNHLKAYGLTYWTLDKKGLTAEWLLNYRNGSFLLGDRADVR